MTATPSNEMTAIGRNNSSQGGIRMPNRNRPPSVLHKIKHIILKDVTARQGRVAASFCFSVMTDDTRVYHCRSPPLLTF
ncbi:MAG: hypothetical protein ACRC9L_02635 [Brevinema sp.]